MAILVTDNTFLRQFEVEINGVLAKIEYSEQERKIFLTKLIIPESVTNKNFQENFIKEVLSIIEDRNVYVMPTSPQIVSFIRKNKQYKHLLPIGVRI
ncbi:MAG: N-acetyltransferase [Flavobacteriaceae bacterium]|nr:N-acetyltransferase [Flavobacteriaceae bacterium]MDG2314862.1 N-acetyltransferase [Flavobacteriaceae bacterium]